MSLLVGERAELAVEPDPADGRALAGVDLEGDGGELARVVGLDREVDAGVEVAAVFVELLELVDAAQDPALDQRLAPGDQQPVFEGPAVDAQLPVEPHRVDAHRGTDHDHHDHRLPRHVDRVDRARRPGVELDLVGRAGGLEVAERLAHLALAQALPDRDGDEIPELARVLERRVAPDLDARDRRPQAADQGALAERRLGSLVDRDHLGRRLDGLGGEDLLLRRRWRRLLPGPGGMLLGQRADHGRPGHRQQQRQDQDEAARPPGPGRCRATGAGRRRRYRAQNRLSHRASTRKAFLSLELNTRVRCWSTCHSTRSRLSSAVAERSV